MRVIIDEDSVEVVAERFDFFEIFREVRFLPFMVNTSCAAGTIPDKSRGKILGEDFGKNGGEV